MSRAAEERFGRGLTRMNADLRLEKKERLFALCAKIRVDPRQKITFTMKNQGR